MIPSRLFDAEHLESLIFDLAFFWRDQPERIGGLSMRRLLRYEHHANRINQIRSSGDG